MVKSTQFELRVEAKLENLAAISDFIVQSMKRLGIGEGIYEIQTAVDEACTNIIKYAYEDGEGSITILCSLQDNCLVIAVQDHGKPFDPRSIPPPDLEADWEERQIGGLGIFLMRKLMDEVSYSFDPVKGNTLTMKRRIAKASPD